MSSPYSLVTTDTEGPGSMGSPGEYDNPRIEEAFDRVSAAAKVSVNGRLLSVGFGGLQ